MLWRRYFGEKVHFFPQQTHEIVTVLPHLCWSQSYPSGLPHDWGNGTMVKVDQTCEDCSYIRTWDSQPSTGQPLLGNLVLSVAVLFTGCQASQILRLFSIMNIQRFFRSTYQCHQNDYVIPTVINGWKKEQASIMAGLRDIEDGLQLAGDCKNDSPGHSVQYGTYTLVEQTQRRSSTY